MKPYLYEAFDNDLYKVKHIAGMKASGTLNPTYHSHNKLIFSYCIKGGGSIIAEGTKYDISDGDVLVIKPAEFFSHKIDDNYFHERIVLTVYPQIFKNLPGNHSAVLSPFFKRKSGEKNCIPRNIVNEYHLDKLFLKLLEHSKENSETESILAFSKVLEILVTTNKIITQSLTKDEGDIIKSSKVDDILKYLNDNYTKDISVTDVARQFNLDRAYISRLFKSQMGMSIWDYVIMRRIYLFNYLIEDSNSLEETAYRVGFKNYSNFYRLYKKHMQMSPIEFKKYLYNTKNGERLDTMRKRLQ